MSSNLAVAVRPVLLNALRVVDAMPIPEKPSHEILADLLITVMFSPAEVPTLAENVAEAKPKKARAKKAAEPVAEAAPVAEEKPAEKPKKSRAKKAAEAPLPASDAEAPAAEKPKKAKKEKVVGANIEKLTPTQMKLLKPIADELKVEVDKAKFLEFLNGLSADVYAAKNIYDHFRDFVKPAEPEERESIVVDFNGKTYYVTPEDKKVWEETDDGVHKFVGHVGMAAFADMKMPEL